MEALTGQDGKEWKATEEMGELPPGSVSSNCSKPARHENEGTLIDKCDYRKTRWPGSKGTEEGAH